MFEITAPGYQGYPRIEDPPIAAPAALNLLTVANGLLVTGEDSVYGQGEFVFGRANGAIRQYGLCVATPVWDATNRIYTWNFTEAPATANLGRPLYVAQCAGAMSAGQYGWFMTTGITPVNCNATVAADTTFGIAAAGQGGANVAGRQVVNARVVAPSTQTVIKAGIGVVGDNRIWVPNVEGWFVGGYLSGTGVGASAVVQAIDQAGQFIVASVVNAAAINGNVTLTYNNATIHYNVAQLNRAFAQGAIT